MDHEWWREYHEEVKQVFAGRRVTVSVNRFGIERIRFPHGENSGAGAIALAAHFGARRIILLGYDCKVGDDGKRHWHGDHPKPLGNAGSMHKWPEQFARLAKRMDGVEIVNASRDTALTLWPRAELEMALGHCCAQEIIINGMHGLGDNLHQRAIVREYMRSHRVYLMTPWPELYHDLHGERLVLIRPKTTLRTQAKNTKRSEAFDEVKIPKGLDVVSVRYPPESVRKHLGVLPAMAAQCGVPDARNFSMPVPDNWSHGLNLPAGRPVIVYRPLVERKEWGGAAVRNPNRDAYVRVLDVIRKETGAFVVSVADIEPGHEWIVSRDIGADMELHRGELGIQQLCALWRDASLIYTAPGFGLVMAQAIGKPVVSMFGGYERAYSFRDDALTCKIEPDDPCDCFSHRHSCGKKMNVDRAIKTALEFVNALDIRGKA